MPIGAVQGHAKRELTNIDLLEALQAVELVTRGLEAYAAARLLPVSYVSVHLAASGMPQFEINAQREPHRSDRVFKSSSGRMVSSAFAYSLEQARALIDEAAVAYRARYKLEIK